MISSDRAVGTVAFGKQTDEQVESETILGSLETKEPILDLPWASKTYHLFKTQANSKVLLIQLNNKTDASTVTSLKRFCN